MTRPVIGFLLALLPAVAFADPVLKWTHPDAYDFTIRVSTGAANLNAGGSSLKSATATAAKLLQVDGTYRYDAAPLVLGLAPGGYRAWVLARDRAKNRSAWACLPFSVGGGALPVQTDIDPPVPPSGLEDANIPPAPEPPPDPDPPTPPPPPPIPEPPAPAPTPPAALFADDFEDGTWSDTWDPTGYCCETDGQPGLSLADRNSVRCGGYGFEDNCAAHSGSRGGYWAHGPRFAESEEIYIRWYSYFSNPWTPDPGTNKLMDVNDGAISMQAFCNSSLFGSGKPAVILYGNGQAPCAAQPTPLNGEYARCVNRYQNQSNDLRIEPGNWYLFEWHCKLNTVGSQDGVTRLWVDKVTPGVPGPATQTLRLEYTDCTFRSNTAQKFRQLWLTAYQTATSDSALPQAPANQTEKWDRIVVSRSKIGPR